MKKFFLTIGLLLCICSSDVNASTYYLSSSSGNDNFSGIFPDSAWETIGKINSITLLPGDSVLLKCNDEFYGTLIIQNSGSINSPIYFGKYGIGALPIITGFKKLTGWNNNGNVFSLNDTNHIKSIWFNDKWMQPARYPNSGLLSVYSSFLSTGIFSPDLIQSTGYWNNSSAVIRANEFQYDIAEIINFDQGFLTFAGPISQIIPQFHGFYLQNHLGALDTLNEWYCDTLNQLIFIIPPQFSNISNATIEGSVLEYGILCNEIVSHLIFDSLSFTGQSIDAIRFSKSINNIEIKNSSFKKIKQQALRFFQTSNHVKILNNKISDTGGDAISSFFLFNGKIAGNEIRRTGINIGFGYDKIYQAIAIHLESGIHDTIIDNYIDSTCYNAISLYNLGNRIERNFINHSSLNLNFGGGITLFGNESNSVLIKDNFILNTRGDVTGLKFQKPFSFGIFLNDYCHHDSIINNTIINSDSYGIYVGQFNHHHFIKGNVLYNNQAGQVFITDGATQNSTNQIELKNNILYSLNHNQKVVQLNAKSENFLPLNSDSNYYCNPYDYFPIYEEINSDTIIEKKVFSLSSWNQNTLQDSNSHVSNVEWKNQYATDTTGNDLISNGNFTNNYDDWSTIPLNNNSLLLDNLTMMDGGCIKFEITATDSTATAKIVSNQFPFQNNQYYEMSFSVSGSNESIVRSDITYQVSPYGSVGFNKYFPIETSRRDYNYFFQSTQYITPLALSFELHQPDSLVYFDNIHLFPVSVFKHDSILMSVLLMNYSPNTVSIPLGADSVFRDLDGNIVTGSYLLNPYSSYVLVLDSPLHLITVKEIQKQNSIHVFPNPVQATNGKITVQLPDENKYDYEVYDLTGRKFLSGKFSGSTINAFSMKNASAGMYILSIRSDNKVWHQKIVVVN